ncbi:MAG: TolC family protein [Armatimonadota bacterium]|nr:TolC family protein [bacterium]
MARPGCVISLSILLLMPCLSITADEVKQPKAYSLQDCISVAMRNNIDVLTAQNNVIAAKSRSASAKSEYLPQISLQNNAFVWGSESVLNQSTTGTAFSVDQNIFDGGLREANAQSARYGVTQNKSGQTRTLQTVTYNVSKAYYEVLRSRHLAEVAQANVTYNEGLRDQIQARADVGDAAKVDVLPIEAQLASARVSLLSAQNSLRTSAIELQKVMGVPSKSSFDVQEISDAPKTEIASLDDYITAASKSRPDIMQSHAATGAARASVRSSRIALYPRPVISANYQRQISGGFTTSGTQLVGGIVFNIFNGGANRAAYREAQANRANAELQEQQLSIDINSEVEEAYLSLTNARERMTASSLSLQAADRNYQAQKERYSQGLGTTLDLLNAEVQVITAQSDDVQSRYDYYIAVTQIDYVVGKQGGTL